MTPAICSVDFETLSQADLPRVGLYKYVEHPSTDVWCMGWAIEYGKISLWRRGQPFPPEIAEHMRNGGLIRGWNVAFERAVWEIMTVRHSWPRLAAHQTLCTQAQALTQGFPAALDKCAFALGIRGKDQAGHKLMMKMCKPRLVNLDGSVIWWDSEDEQRRLGTYCMQDVEIERSIASRLVPISDNERRIYLLDQRINDRGMLLDHELVHAGLTVVGQTMKRLDADVRRLTAGMVANTRKRQDLVKWLNLHGDLEDDVESIDKHALADYLKRDDLTEATRAVLSIRQEAAKSSTAKLQVMQRASNKDGRIRGTFRYYGARQTGRWAGHLLQPQNFPRGHVKAELLEEIVADIKRTDESLDTTMIEVMWGSPLDVVSSVLRGCIVSAPGKSLLVADFNAIEARVLAWLAGNDTLMNLFRTGGDPYRRMAAKVYQTTLEAVTGDQRWLGKQLVLSCGYQCGWRNFQGRVAKEGVEIDDYDARDYIQVYRQDNPEITELWRAMDEGAKNAIEYPGTVFQHPSERIAFLLHNRVLYMRLPSMRKLAYLDPKVEKITVEGDDGPYEREQITFWGVNPITWQWCRMYTYGSKLVENAVQAISRDALASAMLRVDAAGYPIVLHVHDEIVAELDDWFADLAYYLALISEVPAWLAGCPIKVEGWQGRRYRK